MKSIYLALGDSLTKGYGVGIKNSFPTIYYNSICRHYSKLDYFNEGINGLTSGELANLVRKSYYSTLISKAKIITITIGSNDLISIGKGFISGASVNVQQVLRNLNRNLIIIANQIRTLNPHAIVKIASIYNPLTLNKHQIRHLSHRLIKAANISIERIAKQFGIILVPIHKAFWKREPFLLGPDRLHPNIIGHRVMAEMFYLN